MPIDVSAVPHVAVDFMNDDHAEEARLVNAVEAALEEGEDVAVDEALTALVDHTREHFAREEEAMESTGFPAFPMHKFEHERVLAEVGEIVRRWSETRDRAALGTYVREALPTWFVEHIQSMDAVTSQYLANAGL